MNYEYILREVVTGGVGLIRMNRPQSLNALSVELMAEIQDALKYFDQDPSIGCMIITGTDRVFAAGADIKQMADKSASDMFMETSLIDGFDLSGIHKPIIAAVSGFALGGGCELAMACDMIVASDTAVFGQPEINLGIIPGGGGTQRLIQAVGKALAMEIILTDRRLTADEAYHYGLVNQVVAIESYLDAAIKLAQKVADKSQIAIRLAKDAVNKALEVSLKDGLDYEKRNFYILFETQDKKEGMHAFIEKRAPKWVNR